MKVNYISKFGKFVKKGLWYLMQSRNIIVVVVTSFIGYQWIVGTTPFKLSGKRIDEYYDYD